MRINLRLLNLNTFKVVITNITKQVIPYFFVITHIYIKTMGYPIRLFSVKVDNRTLTSFRRFYPYILIVYLVVCQSIAVTQVINNGTAIIIYGTPDKIYIGADSRTTYASITTVTDTTCKIRQIGNKFLMVSGITGYKPAELDLYQIAEEAIKKTNVRDWQARNINLYAECIINKSLEMMWKQDSTNYKKVVKTKTASEIAYVGFDAPNSYLVSFRYICDTSEYLPWQTVKMKFRYLWDETPKTNYFIWTMGYANILNLELNQVAEFDTMLGKDNIVDDAKFANRISGYLNRCVIDDNVAKPFDIFCIPRNGTPYRLIEEQYSKCPDFK